MRIGLAREGEPSLLAGVNCGNAVIQRHVNVDKGVMGMSEDNFVASYDMALIDAKYNPRVGQVLEHPDGRWRLDRLFDDNGVTRRFIVVAAPA